MKLGIDFGTTRTVVACADRGNYPVVSFIDAAGDAHDYYPSVVAERAGELRFGLDAVAVAEDPVVHARALLQAPASQAPDAGPGRARCASERARRSRMAEASSRTSASAARRAPRRAPSCAVARRAPFDCAPSAVPANAHGAQRLVTLDAFRRAGFDAGRDAQRALRRRLRVHAPAPRHAIVEARPRRRLRPRRRHVRRVARAHERAAPRGPRHRGHRNRLGGDDFDALLAGLALARAGRSRRRSRRARSSALPDQCRDAKERAEPELAQDDDRPRASAAGRPRPRSTVPVAEFYEACAPLVERIDRGDGRR